MLRRVAFGRTEVSEESRAPITESVKDSCHHDDGGARFLRNVDSYKNHAAQHPRRRHFSNYYIKNIVKLEFVKITYLRIFRLSSVVILHEREYTDGNR
jgi:hypothetical protein